EEPGMQRSTGCLAEHELLALLVDEPDSGTSRSHVGACSECHARLEELRSQLSDLRAIGPFPHRSSAVSTAADPGIRHSGESPAPCRPEPGATGGPQDRGSTTRPCPAGPTHRGAPSWPGDEETTDRETAIPAAIGKYLVVGRFDGSGQADV